MSLRFNTAPLKLRAEQTVLWVYLLSCCALAAVFILLPLLNLFALVTQADQAISVTLNQHLQYLLQPYVLNALWNSFYLSFITAMIGTGIAFGCAYALCMTKLKFADVYKVVFLLPLLAPPMMIGIGLVCAFGNQGLLKNYFQISSIYGEVGIVAGSILWTLPHALLILLAPLSSQDARLREAALLLGANPVRVFLTVVLPTCRYGLLTAFTVVFVLTLTDFSIPKVLGGQVGMIATELYKQVVGQQQFGTGAFVSIVLLIPSLLASLLAYAMNAKQARFLDVKAVLYTPSAHRLRDSVFNVYCLCVVSALLVVIGFAVYAAFATFWPYQLMPTLKHFDFEGDTIGWDLYGNTLIMAVLTALFGTCLAFCTAWLVQKNTVLMKHGFAGLLGRALHIMACLPMAVPGLALGLAYVLLFNEPRFALHGLYATMGLLVVCTVVHFFSVAHLTLLAAMKQWSAEYDWVASTLGVPFWKTMIRVHIPVCLPVFIEVFGLFLINAMTTVSAVVFLYSPNTQLASIAMVNAEDTGDVASAAALASLILLTTLTARVLLSFGTSRVLKKTQAWRVR